MIVLNSYPVCYRNRRKLVDNIEQRIAMVRDDHEHGSRWLVHETISILYDLATRSTSSPDEGLRKLQDAGRELAQARPAMAAIAGAVGRILTAPGVPKGKTHKPPPLLH